MICSIIYEGTAPRYAPGGLLPASKPVAPSPATITHRVWPGPCNRGGYGKFNSLGVAEPGLAWRKATVAARSPGARCPGAGPITDSAESGLCRAASRDL